MTKMKKEYIIAVTVHKVPHEDKERAIDLIGNLVIKNYSKELEHANALAREQ